MTTAKLCKVLALLYGIFASFQLLAQTGTDFWFVVPEVISATTATNRGRTPLEGEHGDRPGVIRINSLNQPATVTISRPADASFTPKILNLGAFETRTDTITDIDEVENWPANTILNKGIFIKSTAPITAYYEEASQNNPEIFPLKASNALGKLFYIPSQNEFRNQRGSAAFDIVATEDNTTIRITLSNRVRGTNVNDTTPAFLKGDVITIVLNKGQTYSCRAVVGTRNPSLNNKLTGTKIEADKPIAVVYTDDSIITGTNGWDLVGDQLVPVPIVGTEYIAVTGKENQGKEVIYITSTQPNTRIYVNGATTPTATLAEAGSTYSIKMSVNQVATYVRTDKPAYAVHLSGLSTSSSTGGEQGDAVLPPINCTGTNSQRFVRTTGLAFSIMLLTKNGNQDGFKLIVPRTATIIDTLNILAADSFKVVPGTNNEWVAARFDFAMGDIRIPNGSNRASQITNNKGLFHMGMLNNVGASATYGYFSDYSPISLPDDLLAVEGEPVILAPNTNNSYAGEKFRWFQNNVLFDTVSSSITVYDSGIYKINYTAPGCPELEDSVRVRFAMRPTFNLWDGKRDTTVCQNSTLSVSVQIPSTDLAKASTFYSYEWFDVQTNARLSQTSTLTLVNRAAGTFRYRVRVTDFSTVAQAFRNDTITVTVNPAPRAGLGLQDTICFYSLPHTLRANPADSLPIYAYRWNNSPSDTFSYYITNQQNSQLITVPLQITNKLTGCQADTQARLWVELSTGFIPQIDLGDRIQFIEKSTTPYQLRTTTFPINVAFPPRYVWNWLENPDFGFSTTANPYQNPISVNTDTLLGATMTYTLTAISGSSAVVGSSMVNVKPFCQTTDTVTLVVYQKPKVNLPADTAYCEGQKDSLTINAFHPDNTSTVHYLWNTGDTTPQIRYLPTPNKTDTIIATVSDTIFGRTFAVSDTMLIRAIAPLAVKLGSDTTVEKSSIPLIINAKQPSHPITTSYMWNDDIARNKDTAIINLNLPNYTTQTFWVSVTDNSTTAQCVSSDTVRVHIFERPVVPTDTIKGVCKGNFPIVLRAKKPSHSSSVVYWWDGVRGADSLVVFNPDTIQLILRDTAFATLVESTTNFYVIEQDVIPLRLGADTLVQKSVVPFLLRADSVNSYQSFTWRKTGDSTILGNTATLNVDVNFPKYTRLSFNATGVNRFANANCITKDTIEILIYEKPFVFLGNDTIVCQNSSPLMISNRLAHLPQNTNVRYTWQNNTHNPTYLAQTTQNQTIIVAAVDTLIPQGKSFSFDTLRLTVQSLPQVDLGNDRIFNRSIIPIKVENTLNISTIKYEWQNGATGSSQFISLNYHRDTTMRLVLMATDSLGCSASDTLAISVLYRPLVSLPFKDTTICPDRLPFLYDALYADNPLNLTYQWLQKGSVVGNESVLQATDSGEYVVIVSDNRYSPPRLNSDTIRIHLFNRPVPTIISSQNKETDIAGICIGSSELLSVRQHYKNYVWSTSDTTAVIKIPSEVRTYWVVVTDENGCKGTDSISIKSLYSLPKWNISQIIEPICEEGIYQFNGLRPHLVKVLWEDGLEGTNRSLEENGVYVATLIDKNGCSAQDTIEVWYKCINEISLPTAFTPNNDGINDIFKPLGRNIISYEMTIYNRWGEVVYHTKTKGEGWDGKFSGNPVVSGVYFYKVTYEIQHGKERKQGSKEGALQVLENN